MMKTQWLPASVLFFVCVLACAEDAPPAPTDVSAEALSASHIRLKWRCEAKGHTGFRIESQTAREWELLGSASADAANFDATGVLGGKKHTLRICAVSAHGNSLWAELSVTTPAPAAEPKGKLLVEHTKESPRNGEGTFLELKDGSVVYYFGSFTGLSDTAISRIGVTRSTDRGDTWSAPMLLFKEKGVSLLHPSLARMGNGGIGLAYSKLIDGKHAKKMFRHSNDDGKTWSDEIAVSDGVFDYMTGAHSRLLCLSNKRLLNQVHAKMTFEGGRPKLGTFTYVSDDNGLTWQRRPKEPLTLEGFSGGESGFYETTILETAPGKLLMLGRNASGWLYESRSEDSGDTWTPPAQTSVRNPLAPAMLLPIPGGDALVVFHNSYYEKGKAWHNGERVILASRISRDAGMSWTNYREIEYTGAEHWYDYPSGIWLGDTLLLAYRDIGGADKSKYIDVRFQKLSKESLLNSTGNK